jgi:hypothetical protein
LENFEVHLYDNGHEVSTSASAKRVELTTDEAFQYAVVEHLTDLRAATQPPQPARSFWPADLPARLAADNQNRLMYVRVDRHGGATGAFHDAVGKLPITDADIAALLPMLYFFPALDKGKAVSGMCQVNLGEVPL